MLLVPKLADSLAGRMEILRLHPLAQCELGRSAPGFLEALLKGGFRMRQTERLGSRLAERIVAGGFPAALDRPIARRRAAWCRDKDGAEVDIVIERGAQTLAGVEVKASSTVTATDFRGLRRLREAAGGRFAGGVVLYDGETSASFGQGLHAVPLSALWETT